MNIRFKSLSTITNTFPIDYISDEGIIFFKANDKKVIPNYPILQENINLYINQAIIPLEYFEGNLVDSCGNNISKQFVRFIEEVHPDKLTTVISEFIERRKFIYKRTLLTCFEELGNAMSDITISTDVIDFILVKMGKYFPKEHLNYRCSLEHLFLNNVGEKGFKIGSGKNIADMYEIRDGIIEEV